MTKKTSVKKSFFSILAVSVLLLLILLAGSSFFGDTLSKNELEAIEKGVRRAAVQCYAIEGFYPGTLDYLTEKYGISQDSDRYFIDYRYIGANLMPDITVVSLSH